MSHVCRPANGASGISAFQEEAEGQLQQKYDMEESNNMKTLKKVVIAAGTLGFALTGAANAGDGWDDSGQGVQQDVADNLVLQEEEAQAIKPNGFGLTVFNKLQIPAAAFTTRCGDTNYRYSSPGYIYATDVPCGNAFVFWAPVQLPSGALIKWFDAYYYDGDTSFDLTFVLHAYKGWNSPSFSALASNSTSGSGGYGYIFKLLSPPYTVNNNVRYHADGAQLAAIVSYPNLSTALSNKLRFKAVDIWWQRQISPAPATATFSDVPTDYWAFEGIEALAASGITTGCGGTNFCPDDNVTRAQMALFLARALGLHWPN